MIYYHYLHVCPDMGQLGIISPESGITGKNWVLEHKLRSSVRIICTLNHWAITPVPNFKLLNKIQFKESVLLYWLEKESESAVDC